MGMFRFSRLSLKGHLLIARGSSAYYSWAVRLLLFARMFIFENILQYCHPTLERPLFKALSGWW